MRDFVQKSRLVAILNLQYPIVLWVIAVVILNSCAFKKQKSRDEDSNKAQHKFAENIDDPAALAESELIYEFLPKGFQKYALRVIWPKDKKLLAEVVFKEDPENLMLPAIVKSLDTEVTSYIDIPCPSGLKIDVMMLFKSKVLMSETGRIEITRDCPKDFAVTKEMNGKDLPFDLNGRLFFNDGSKIKLENTALSYKNLIGIVVDGSADIELINSQRGSISAKLELITKEMHGRLSIKLRGANGRNGIDGELKKQEDELFKNRFTYNLPQVGDPGDPGIYRVTYSRPTKSNDGKVLSIYECSPHPGNGKDGEDGKVAGLDGDPGEDGLPSPSILIGVKRPTPALKIIIKREPGFAGKGGQGGVGQKGAEGGPPGLNPNKQCQEALPGKRGKDAPDGRTGQDGKSGYCLPIYLSGSIANLVDVSGQNELGEDCDRDKKLIQYF